MSIGFPGNRVAGPWFLREAYDFLIDCGPFRVRDLPGPIADDARIVLARRLVRAGLLRRVSQGSLVSETASR